MIRFFDLLFTRYSQPFRLIDRYIHSCCFLRFVDEFVSFVNESEAWDFWLHKETGRSWEDFRLSVIPQEADTEKLSETINDIEKKFAEGVFNIGTV